MSFLDVLRINEIVSGQQNPWKASTCQHTWVCCKYTRKYVATSTRLIQQRNCRLYIAKLQNKFHVSAAEVDEQDTHQIIVIGVAAIVPHNAAADSLMEKISQFVEESTEAEIIDEERELR